MGGPIGGGARPACSCSCCDTCRGISDPTGKPSEGVSIGGPAKWLGAEACTWAGGGRRGCCSWENGPGGRDSGTAVPDFSGALGRGPLLGSCPRNMSASAPSSVAGSTCVTGISIFPLGTSFHEKLEFGGLLYALLPFQLGGSVVSVSTAETPAFEDSKVYSLSSGDSGLQCCSGCSARVATVAAIAIAATAAGRWSVSQSVARKRPSGKTGVIAHSSALRLLCN